MNCHAHSHQTTSNVITAGHVVLTRLWCDFCYCPAWRSVRMTVDMFLTYLDCCIIKIKCRDLRRSEICLRRYCRSKIKREHRCVSATFSPATKAFGKFENQTHKLHVLQINMKRNAVILTIHWRDRSASDRCSIIDRNNDICRGGPEQYSAVERERETATVGKSHKILQ